MAALGHAMPLLSSCVTTGVMAVVDVETVIVSQCK